MAENLAYLPEVCPEKENCGYWVYNYQGTNISNAKKTQNYKTYGVLYSYRVAEEVCPYGYHLPSDTEWEQLAEYIGNNNSSASKKSDNWQNMGTILKTKSGWNSNNGTDNYGFAALPSGYRNDGNSSFKSKGYDTYFWSCTLKSDSFAWERYLWNQNNDFGRAYSGSKNTGLSVRCIKD